ncbi:hypothetical protein MBRA1_001028 [Malassezia brasiliensis]|uniref:Uncharacterized protein n=1 Tax=Malassezia brasiliensis TaxID=1821822 RepID=A0AAF0IRY7_9BASI|nr:hypothetical protein MBRA1_001028 [Malassezia brasiliensis]
MRCRPAEAWVEALAAGAACEDPIAWSRHNVVAHAEVDAQGACVCLRRAAHLSQAPITKLYAPAHPAGGSLARPNYLSFSPCGYTLFAYFPPGAPLLRNATHFAPYTGLTTGLATPIGLDAGTSPMPYASTPAGAATGPAWQSDQGMVCIWTRAGDAWTLRQTVPVCDAASAPTTHAFHGHVVDVCWLGAPRAWSLDAPLDAPHAQPVRLPACGPAALLALPSLPLDQAQDELAVVVCTNTAQVSVLHRLPGRASANAPFRVHHGWLAQPSVLPPPPTLEHTRVERCESWMRRVTHLRACAVPDAAAVLVAYATDDPLCAPAVVHLTELQLELDGEMSFLTVQPLAGIPTSTAELCVGAAPLGDTRLTHLAWVQRAASLELWLALDGAASPGAPGGTQLVAWAVHRPVDAADDDVHAPRTPTLVPRVQAWTEAYCVTMLLPHALGVYATAAHGDDEVWATISPESLALTPLSTSLPRAALRRSPLAVSPSGAVACAMLDPSGAVACWALPLPHAPFDRCAGRLVALATLRHASCADVAVWARPHAALPDALPRILHVAADALQLGDTPTLSQLLVLCTCIVSLDLPRDAPVRRRATLLLELAALHRQLVRARTDANTAPFAARLASDAHVAFAPAHAWTLVEGLRQILGLLAGAARHAASDATAGTPCDALLELLAFPAPARLVADVLAGYALFAAYLERVPLRTFASPLLDAQQLPASAARAADSWQAVQSTAQAAIAHAPLDLRAAAAALAAHAPPPAPWDTLFAPRDTHRMAPAWALARKLYTLAARPEHLWDAAPEVWQRASLLRS